MQRFILRFIYCFLVRWFLKIIVGVKFDNASFLLEQKQFIIVANHNSHLDTMTIMASLPGKLIDRVKPVAAADYFGKTKLQEQFSNYFINTLLISRKRDKGNPENDPVSIMLKAIDSGYSLILFPEGTRGEPEIMQTLKPGIGIILSSRPHVPYVPAFMAGMGKVMPKGDNLLIPHNSSLRYGRPTHSINSDVPSILKQIENDLLQMKND